MKPQKRVKMIRLGEILSKHQIDKEAAESNLFNEIKSSLVPVDFVPIDLSTCEFGFTVVNNCSLFIESREELGYKGLKLAAHIIFIAGGIPLKIRMGQNKSGVLVTISVNKKSAKRLVNKLHNAELGDVTYCGDEKIEILIEDIGLVICNY